MVSLEQEIRTYFQQRRIPFADHTGQADRFQRLDFGFGDAGAKRLFHFDAKEKRQHYKLSNWPASDIPEPHLFILDDLAARKILLFAPNSGIVVRDNVRPAYYLFTIADLFLMPKQRVNRPIRHHQRALKGKWLIDLRNGLAVGSLAGIFASIEAYLDHRQDIFRKELACFGSYVGEDIGEGGSERQPQHWHTDVSETR